MKKNTYQNGAYWGTPTGWVCNAIARVNLQAAKKLADSAAGIILALLKI